MGLLSWIVVGLIAGALAKFIMPGDDPGGCIVTTIIGIVGAVIGGFLSRSLLGFEAEGFSLASILIAVVGSIVLLLIYRLVAGRRRK
ncbi:MAG: GlsB/YeaQ/YmgE family stress response membrane protein [Gemmatimonadetes bacterium]|nr:GlsB/YeaQ/YmgE family stress response membrane protein [Gemmatimonadota bacterium]